ncbi:hypothetical protein CRENPOLYSF2_830024 [Crenothrix polyspora]|uniref:Uncharacterized protein n=1 Tax=Crenothrix polyspora TaxID=360316 RepID=A0A1R4HIJ5_9GAMM|nr:hypothetical protein CRENPOLYSF2_830024 [Crenothrix polyspora]
MGTLVHWFGLMPCLLPSPNMVKDTITKTVLTTSMMNLLGLSIKNSAHFGLIIPTIKKSAVSKPKLIAAVTNIDIYLLDYYLNDFQLLLLDTLMSKV